MTDNCTNLASISFDGPNASTGLTPDVLAELYPRIVEVHRTISVESPATPQQDVGELPYSGETQGPAGEETLFTGLAASIQIRAAGRTKGPLPADVYYKPGWVIHIPMESGIAIYDIRDRDIIIDDEEYRYSVTANYWTGIGYQLECIRLEA